MVLQSLLPILQSLALLTSAATIRGPSNGVAEPQLLQLLLNTTDGTSNIHPAIPATYTGLLNTTATHYEAVCIDGPLATVNPASCRNAIRKIPRSANYITIGWRGTGSFDLTLPYVFLSDDARCAVYVVGRDSRRPDIYSFLGFSEAAEQIQHKCVGDPGLRCAGYVDQIGRYKDLIVLIVPQVSHVECQDTPAPSYSSCRSVLDTMPWETDLRIFGQGGEIPLPYILSSVDYQCVFQITSNGAASITSWAAVFRAIAAVDEVCVKNGKSGRIHELGSAPYLSVSIVQRAAIADS